MASRTNNIIYNNYDRYTGVLFNAVVVAKYHDGANMDDSKVDNAIYFKNTVALGGGYCRREWEGDIDPRWFGVINDGVTDNLAIFTKMFKICSGLGRIKFPKNETYFLSDNIHIDYTLDIDLNGCVLNTFRGLFDVDITNQVVFDNGGLGNLFQAVKGNMFFAKIAGVTDNWKVGTIAIARSKTAYIEDGDYHHGQIMVVKAISGSTISIHNGFYESFQVDSLTVYTGEDFTIKNGTIDMTTCPGSNKGIQLTGYDTITVSNMIFLGSDNAAAGTELLGNRVLIEDSYGSGFLNTIGLNPITGGREGYAFNLTANLGIVNNCGGDRCKHLFCNGNRNVTSLKIEVNGFEGYNPREDFDKTSVISGGGPLHQHMIDFHANCLQAYVNNPVLDGCNGMVAFRNGWGILNKPVFRSRAVAVGFNNSYLVIAYEHQIESIIINEPTVYVDPPITGQTAVASLMGLQTTSLNSDNKDIRIINPNMNGGYLFTSLAGIIPAPSGTINLRLLSITGAKGFVSGGVDINGQDADRLFGNVGTLEIQGDLTIVDTVGATREIVQMSFVSSIDTLILKNSNFDWRAFQGAGAVINIQHTGISLPPKHIISNDTTIRSPRMGMVFANNVQGNYGPANFINLKLYYNYMGDQAFAPGVFGNLIGTLVNPSVGVWDFTGAEVINQSLASMTTTTPDSLRFLQLAKLKIDNITLNIPPTITDQTYILSELAAKRTPFNVRNIGTNNYIAWGDKRLRADGNLYIPAASQSGPGLSGAVPAGGITHDYNGQLLYNDDYNAIAPYAWASSGSTWVPIVMGNLLTGLLALKANILSPTFTGTPAAPTPALGDNTTKVATTAFIRNALPDVIVLATDANYVAAAKQYIILPVITANRTVALPGTASVVGFQIKVQNLNTSGFTWTFTGGYINADGSSGNSIVNGSIIILESDGTNWVKINDTADILLNNRMSAAASLTLTSGYTTFTGSTATWTLPTQASAGRQRFILINSGSGDITLNTAAGELKIWESGVLSNTLTISPGEVYTLYDNTQNFIIIN